MDSFQERKHKNFQVESDPFFGHLWNQTVIGPFVPSLMLIAMVIDTCTLAIRQNQNETIESVRGGHIAGVNNENEIFS